jgi:surface protein
MARTDTLANFLTDIANSVRAKTGSTEKIAVKNLDTEIANLESEGGDPIAPATLTFANYTGETINEATIDTSNLTTMANMFSSCPNLKSVNMSTWNTSKVTSMRGMYSSCNNIQSITCGSIDTSKVTDMAYFASRCPKITAIDFSLQNFSSVSTYQEAFTGCSGLLRAIFPSTVKSTPSLKETFSNCTSITYIDMAHIDGCGDWYRTFYNCVSLQHLDIRNMTIAEGSIGFQAFYGIPDACEIIVKDDAAKAAILSAQSNLTNIKTVAELI